MVKLTYFYWRAGAIKRILTRPKLKENSQTKWHREIIILLAALLLWSGQALWSQSGPSSSEPPFTVVLDAGHGGHDPGNLGNGYLEKNIALSIVLEVGKALEKQGGIKVLYTRDDDTFVDLYVRGEIANKAKADLFVSVHCDSHTSNAHGAGTFVLGLHANKQNFEIAKKENSVIYLEDNYETRYADYNINSPESVIGLTIMQEEFLDQSILLGKLMQDRFTGKLGRNDRKVKQAGFIVLHQTFMPSVLVETGFLTNRDEGKYLNSSKGQAEMGQAIAGAIIEYRESVRSGALPDTGVLIENDSPQIEEEVVAQKPAQTEAAAAEVTKPTVEVVQKPQIEDAVVEVSKPASEEKEVADAPATKKPAAEEPVAEKPAATKTGITFKVQLLAVSRDPSLNPIDYKGLKPLSKEKYQDLFRVLYGDTASYNQAQALQAVAVRNGFTSAYVVAYRNGVRIPLKDAIE